MGLRIIQNDNTSSKIDLLQEAGKDVIYVSRLCFYQTRSAWSMDQGSNRKHSAVHNFAPTVTKFCVMWEGQALPHDTKFSNCRCEIVGRRVIFIWSLIPGSSWSGLIKAEPGWKILLLCIYIDKYHWRRSQCWYLQGEAFVLYISKVKQSKPTSRKYSMNYTNLKKLPRDLVCTNFGLGFFFFFFFFFNC